MTVRHLRPANCSSVWPTVRRQQQGEYCLVDYSSCNTSDVCWLVDIDNGCEERDNCFVDIT